MTTPKEWLSIAEVADYLGVPIKTIYDWRYRGTGPRGVKRQNLVRYRRSEVDRWLEAGTDPRPTWDVPGQRPA